MVLAELGNMAGYEVGGVYMDKNGSIDLLAMAIQTGKRSLYTEIKRNLLEPPDLPEDTDEN